MARALIKRLPDDLIDFPASPHQFFGIAAGTLGAAASPADGFDALVADAVRTVADAGAISDSTAQDLAAAAFTPGEFAKANFAPITQQIGDFLGGGDVLTNQSGVAVTSSPAPPSPGAAGVPGKVCGYPPNYQFTPDTAASYLGSITALIDAAAQAADLRESAAQLLEDAYAEPGSNLESAKHGNQQLLNQANALSKLSPARVQQLQDQVRQLHRITLPVTTDAAGCLEG